MKPSPRFSRIWMGSMASESKLGPRQKKVIGLILGVLLAGGSVYYLCTGFFGQISSLTQMMPLLGIAMVLAFINYPPKKSATLRVRLVDYTLAAISVGICVYLVLTERESAMAIAPPTGFKLAAAWVLIFLLLEATRRVMGWPLVGIVLVFLVYAKFGSYLPGILHHWGFDWSRIADYISLSPEGIFSLPIYVCSTIIIFFMIFAAFLRVGGGGDFIVNLSRSILGKYRGGPAKMAVIASSFFGTISGSAVANVATTGTITIPLMKNIGYEAKKAGSIESLASTGGQFMPPIMGAAAFLMAEIIGCGYWAVVVAAFLPAVLYYISLFVIVDFEAAKSGLRGLPKEQIPPWKPLLAQGWFFIIPLIVLIYFLGVAHISAMRACLYALISLVVVAAFSRRTRLGLSKLYEGLRSGMASMTEVTLACACAGIIIGIMYLTNLGINLSAALVTISHGNVVLLLVLAAVTSLILGLGMTTSAC